LGITLTTKLGVELGIDLPLYPMVAREIDVGIDLALDLYPMGIVASPINWV
jgi:hypothetical protein